MDENLLNEFYVIYCGDNLIIKATDKAYELLGLNEKMKIFANGVVIDTIDDWYYRVALLTFLRSRYNINGLIRESRGNTHDASWIKEITIFNGGNYWKEELNIYKSQKASLYEDKPIVIDKSSISKDIIEEWSREFDLSSNGEAERLVYCSYNDKSDKMIYLFKHTYIRGRANDMKYKNKPKVLARTMYLERLK